MDVFCMVIIWGGRIKKKNWRIESEIDGWDEGLFVIIFYNFCWYMENDIIFIFVFYYCYNFLLCVDCYMFVELVRNECKCGKFGVCCGLVKLIIKIFSLLICVLFDCV